MNLFVLKILDTGKPYSFKNPTYSAYLFVL